MWSEKQVIQRRNPSTMAPTQSVLQQRWGTQFCFTWGFSLFLLKWGILSTSLPQFSVAKCGYRYGSYQGFCADTAFCVQAKKQIVRIMLGLLVHAALSWELTSGALISKYNKVPHNPNHFMLHSVNQEQNLTFFTTIFSPTLYHVAQNNTDTRAQRKSTWVYIPIHQYVTTEVLNGTYPSQTHLKSSLCQEKQWLRV